MLNVKFLFLKIMIFEFENKTVCKRERESSWQNTMISVISFLDWTFVLHLCAKQTLVLLLSRNARNDVLMDFHEKKKNAVRIITKFRDKNYLKKKKKQITQMKQICFAKRVASRQTTLRSLYEFLNSNDSKNGSHRLTNGLATSSISSTMWQLLLSSWKIPNYSRRYRQIQICWCKVWEQNVCKVWFMVTRKR